MSNVRNILSSADNTVRKQLDETKGLVNKWDKTGLLEGMNTEYDKHGMAILLENQAKQLVQESSTTGTSANSEQWAGVALPLVRRIFAEIAAKDFVSVQPMNLPSGLVFYLDFKYGTAQPGFTTSQTSNNPKEAGYQQNSVFGKTNVSGDPSEGLYGAGRFGYSINESSTSGISVTSSANTAAPTSVLGVATILTAAAGADSWNYDTVFYNTYSASISANTIYKVTFTSSIANFTNPDLEGVRAFDVSSSVAGLNAVFPQFTTYNPVSKTISFVVSASATAFSDGNAAQYKIEYHTQPTDSARGDFEDKNIANFNSSQNANDINIPEINVELRSLPIVAKTRKLKAIWSPEFAQDLNAYHSIDAEAELTSMLSEYISQEIDLEILDMLIQNAVSTENWSARVGYEYDPSSDDFAFTQNNYALAYNQGTWFQTLGTKIQKVSNKIHQKTLRGGANFLVCSPAVATILESIPGYAADTNGDKMQFAMGVQKVGMLNSRFTVYKNPYMTENLILMGYRGAQFLETGAVYAPYIPLIMTPLVYDPTNFTPRKGVMTRYAKQMVRPEFYGLVKVHGLDRV